MLTAMHLIKSKFT